MDRLPRSEIYEETKDNVRDRTTSRRRTKRRFDSGPDPEKIKQELERHKEMNDQRQMSSISQTQQANNGMVNRFATGNTNDKHAKRAYIGNIPQDTDSIDLECHLNISLRSVGGCLDPGNPILNSSFINLDKRFMFVELRSVEETT